MRPILPPPLGSEIPVWKGRWFLRTLGRWVVRISGWRVIGEFPNIPKAVVIAAPHSAVWDGVIGISAASALNLRPTWMGKDALFRPGLGWLMRLFGGVPTDRSNPNGVVGQTVEQFANSEQLWVVLAPEGTRREVKQWRSGFYHIAAGAGVPIIPVYFHYPERTIGICDVFIPTGDIEADLQALYKIYQPWRGRNGSRAIAENNPAP